MTKSAMVNTNFGKIYREIETLLTCSLRCPRHSHIQKVVMNMTKEYFTTKWAPSVASVLETVLAEAEKS